MSQHIIEEREKGRNEKQDRWAKEREKQSIKNDPDVEYIDVEDFKVSRPAMEALTHKQTGHGRFGP